MEGVLSKGVLSGNGLCLEGVMSRGSYVWRGFCPDGVLSAHHSRCMASPSSISTYGILAVSPKEFATPL